MHPKTCPTLNRLQKSNGRTYKKCLFVKIERENRLRKWAYYEIDLRAHALTFEENVPDDDTVFAEGRTPVNAAKDPVGSAKENFVKFWNRKIVNLKNRKVVKT